MEFQMCSNAKKHLTNIAPPSWWDWDCTQLRKKVGRIRAYLRHRRWLQKRRGLPPEPIGQAKYTWKDYNAARREFKRHCRKVKRIHWRRFIANHMTYEEVAKLKKSLCKDDKVEQCVFKNSDGTYSTPEETMKEL